MNSVSVFPRCRKIELNYLRLWDNHCSFQPTFAGICVIPMYLHMSLLLKTVTLFLLLLFILQKQRKILASFEVFFMGLIKQNSFILPFFHFRRPLLFTLNWCDLNIREWDGTARGLHSLRYFKNKLFFTWKNPQCFVVILKSLNTTTFSFSSAISSW